jgi:signal peptidase I
MMEGLEPNEASMAPKPGLAKTIWREVKSFAEAIVIALLVVTFLFTTVGVAGSSMSPNLYGGLSSSINILDALFRNDRLFIPKYETWLRRLHILGEYQRGDIIIFRELATSPEVGKRRDFLVKRVIAKPGDHLRMQDGQVFINGIELDQSFITDHGGSLDSYDLEEFVVPEDHYYVLGDNRNNSVDSTVFGPVPFKLIAGKATAIIWPPLRNRALNWHALRPPAAFSSIPDSVTNQ